MVAASPVLMQQSPSENEKKRSADPHRGSAPGPRIELHQVGLLDYVYTTGLQCSVSFSIIGRRLVEKKV